MKNVLIKIAMLLLAIVAMFLVYGFTIQVAPTIIAGAAAASLASVYVGLAWSDVRSSRYAIVIAAVAMLMEATYGTLYMLSELAPSWFDQPLADWAVISLALLHGAPFTLLLFLVSLLILHTPAGEQSNTCYDVATIERLTSAVEHLASRQNGEPSKSYTCEHCGAGPFTFAELGTHARKCEARQKKARSNGSQTVGEDLS